MQFCDTADCKSALLCPHLCITDEAKKLLFDVLTACQVQRGCSPSAKLPASAAKPILPFHGRHLSVFTATARACCGRGSTLAVAGRSHGYPLFIPSGTLDVPLWYPSLGPFLPLRLPCALLARPQHPPLADHHPAFAFPAVVLRPGADANPGSCQWHVVQRAGQP